MQTASCQGRLWLSIAPLALPALLAFGRQTDHGRPPPQRLGALPQLDAKGELSLTPEESLRH